MPETVTATADRRAQRIQTLRAVADWLEAHPAARVSVWETRVLHPVATREEMIRVTRSLGGRWKKSTDTLYFTLSREIVPGFTYDVYVERELVCERVVTGVETVEVPDPELVERLPKVAEEREIVEWRCPESIHRLAMGTVQ